MRRVGANLIPRLSGEQSCSLRSGVLGRGGRGPRRRHEDPVREPLLSTGHPVVQAAAVYVTTDAANASKIGDILSAVPVTPFALRSAGIGRPRPPRGRASQTRRSTAHVYCWPIVARGRFGVLGVC